VFRGVLRFVFTFVIPLALMTTYPAQAMLGKLSGATLLSAVIGSLLFALLARLIWLQSIGKYTSASS
jgi:ABC-2 type transport system permease protein